MNIQTKMKEAIGYCDTCKRCEHITSYTIDQKHVATITLECGHTQAYVLITTRITTNTKLNTKLKVEA